MKKGNFLEFTTVIRNVWPVIPRATEKNPRAKFNILHFKRGLSITNLSGKYVAPAMGILKTLLLWYKCTILSNLIESAVTVDKTNGNYL